MDRIKLFIEEVEKCMKTTLIYSQVNHERKPDRSDGFGNREPLPSCVISLDIGSRGSGYSYWIKEESDCVRIGNVDTGM